jgi:peptidyl-prolyl cis-trans isomerase C
MLFHHIRGVASVLAAAAIALLSVMASGGAEETATDDPLVAVVNGVELHRSDVLASARDLPRAYQDQIEQIYPALVERLIDLTLLSQEGERRDLQDDAEVKERVAQFEGQVIRETLIQKHLDETMTDQAIRARYDQFVTEFQPQEEVHARHILVATEEEAKAVITELDAGGDFAAIAQEKSTDTGSGANGGDLGFFTAEQMVPEFSAAAFALEPGKHSAQPVQSQFGWHVIKVEEKRETTPPPFEQMKPEIENQLSQELVGELVAGLREDATIERPEPPAASEPAPAAPEAAPPAEGGEETPPAQ